MQPAPKRPNIAVAEVVGHDENEIGLRGRNLCVQRTIDQEKEKQQTHDLSVRTWMKMSKPRVF